jgi:hypothetical protein
MHDCHELAGVSGTARRGSNRRSRTEVYNSTGYLSLLCSRELVISLSILYLPNTSKTLNTYGFCLRCLLLADTSILYDVPYNELVREFPPAY